MKFCPDCKNMLYSIEEAAEGAAAGGQPGIQLKCRKCPYTEAAPALLYEHNLREDTSARLVVNPYLAQDPTLPRFDTVQCKNEECPTRGKKSDVVGIKIDPVNVVWMYQCAACNTTWKQSARRD